MPGAPLQIGFYLLSVQVGIPVLDDAVLHEQGGATGDKRGGHGRAGVPRIASAGGGAENIYSRCGDIGLARERPVYPCPEKGAKVSVLLL